MKLLTIVGREIFGWIVLLLFWLREIAGWILLVLGLRIFYESFALLLNSKLIQVLPIMFLGFIVFRAGIHMLKVSAAGLICLRAQEQLNETREAAAPRRAAPTRLRMRSGPFEMGQRN
jgi:hypothetical protein